MKKNLIQAFLEAINTKLFFFLLFLYQVFFIFQGIDFSDEGFYGAFYQQIFKDPQSVEYNFMYWLSGIIGGAYLGLFPQFGLLALRFGGVLLITGTIIIVYNILKRYTNTVYIKLGLLIATVLISFDPKDLNYDNLSSLFFVSASWFLFHGLKKNQPGKIFISGIFISLNTFTRIPNVLGLALAAIILFHGFLNKKEFSYQVKQVLIFVSGFTATTIIILLVMKMIGHYNVFVDCLNLVREMGKSTENTHGIKRMIILFRYEYTFTLIKGCVFLISMIAIGAIINRYKDKNNLGKIAKLLAYCMIVLLLVLAIKDTLISWYLLLSLLTGLSLIAAFFTIINKNKDTDLKTLALIGVEMVIIQPLGSDYGLYSMGRYSLWLALPIAVNYYFNLKSISINTITNSKVNNATSSNSFSFVINDAQLAVIRNWTVLSVIILFLFYALTNTWYDSRNRAKMTYQVNNKYLRGVFTTKREASEINELLQESAKYVKKDDYVLAYDLIPLFYPITETKPFVRNSWPKLYDREVFKNELNKAVAKKKILPVIIYQKVNTHGSVEWPDFNNKDWNINQPRNSCIKQFIENNHYKMVWENPSFMIYIPG